MIGFQEHVIVKTEKGDEIMGESDANTLAGSLRHQRKAAFPGRKGLRELAQIMDCQPEEITAWESGFSVPNKRQMQILSETLKINLAKSNGDRNNRKKLTRDALFSGLESDNIGKDALINICAIMRELVSDTEDILAGKPGYKKKAGRIREVKRHIQATLKDK